MANNGGSVITGSPTNPCLSEEEIQNAWYSLGLMGYVQDWEVKYRFAREIEKLVKTNLADKFE